MSTQSEQTLENNLIAQLETLGFGKVRINDEAALLTNLKPNSKSIIKPACQKQSLSKF